MRIFSIIGVFSLLVLSVSSASRGTCLFGPLPGSHFNLEMPAANVASLHSSSPHNLRNTLNLYEVDGISQDGRVVWFGRVFSQGEVPSCAQPAVDGRLLDPGDYQLDVKSRWKDGSLKFAIIAVKLEQFGAGAHAQISFQNTVSCNSGDGLDQRQMIAFNSGKWNASFDVTVNDSLHRVEVKKMLSELAFKDCQLEYWMRGPLVTAVKVQDCTPSTMYDFGWSWNGTQMQHFVTGNAPTASLHPIFILYFVPSTRSVRIDFILENMWSSRMQDQRYSFILRTGPNLAPIYGKSLFTQIAGTRWRKTLWSGPTPGHVRIDHNFAYLTSTRMLPNYDLDVSVDPDSNCKNNGSNCPGYYDFITTDKGIVGGSALFSLWGKAFDNNGEGAPIQREDLLYLYNMADCGRPNGKCAKAWYVLTAERGKRDSELAAEIPGGAGMWNNTANVPYHIRESRTNGGPFYCPSMDDKNATSVPGPVPRCASGGLGTSMGRPLSRHAFPDAFFSDAILPVKAVGTKTLNGWSIAGTSHWLDYSYIAYLLTGDWFYYDEEIQAASYAVDSTNPDQASGSSNYFFGFIAPVPGGSRKWGWGMQTLGRAAIIAVDGSVEQKYYQSMFNSNLEVMEGALGIEQTVLTPTKADSTGWSTDQNCSSYSYNKPVNRWNWGRCTFYSQCTNQNCLSLSNNAIANSFNSLVPGECSAVLQYKSGSISNCHPELGQTVCRTRSNHELPSGYYVFLWGGTGKWSALNGVRTATVVSANEFSIPVDSSAFGPFIGSMQYSNGQLNLDHNSDFVEDWMQWGTITVLGHLQEIGAENVTPIAHAAYKRLLEQLQDPGYNPYMTAVYISPYKTGPDRCSGLSVSRNSGYRSWADAMTGFVPPVAAVKDFHSSSAVTGNFPCSDHGYALVARAASSYLPGLKYRCPGGGFCDGEAAWRFMAVSGNREGKGGAVPYFGNASYRDDPGCSMNNLGGQIKFALTAR